MSMNRLHRDVRASRHTALPLSMSLLLCRQTDPSPGTGLAASKGEYASFRAALRAIEVKLKHDRHTLGRFSPLTGITLPTANPDLGTLADEYLHAWNHHHGRGLYLDADGARWHLRIFDMAVDVFRKSGRGTSGLPDGYERSFHQLEALNYLCAPGYKPHFLDRIHNDLQRWAHAWREDLPGGQV
jgi:hypothetical protein